MTLFVDESTTMLDSESRYLPVLSEPSSRASSPVISCDQKRSTSDAAEPRQVGVDGLVQPTKSASDPKSCSPAVDRHLQCPTARTLHLESSDAEVETSRVSHSGELHRLTGVERKSTQRSLGETIGAGSAETYAVGQHGSSEPRVDSGRSCTGGSFDGSSDSCSWTSRRTDLADNNASVNDIDLDQQGTNFGSVVNFMHSSHDNVLYSGYSQKFVILKFCQLQTSIIFIVWTCLLARSNAVSGTYLQTV